MSSTSGDPTIEDVARLAGVSRSAVSKVIRDAAGVSADMRQRVTLAIDQLDYRPKTAARAMRGRTFTLGIHLPDFSNPFFAEILSGAMERLPDDKYQLVLSPESGPTGGWRALTALVDRQVDGAIAISPRVSEEELARLAARIPLLVFGRHATSPHYDTIAADDALGVRLAVEHVLARGHDDITHLTLVTAMESGRDPHGFRLREFRSVIDAVRGVRGRLLRCGEGQESAYLATRDALRNGFPSTAIFAAHDDLALGALRAVKEAGAEIDVIGFDDVAIARFPGIDLSTVRQPARVMGARAVDLLLERIQGRSKAVAETFAPELIVRASSSG